MLNKLDTTDKEDLLKVLLKVTPLIEEVEPVDKIDLENKVEEEEMLVMLKTNSTKINIKNLHNKLLLQLLLKKNLLNKQNHKNPKN